MLINVVLMVNHAARDDSVEVDVDEIQSGRRAPMSEQAGFDVLALEQRVVVQINLADGQIIGRPPIGIQLSQRIRTQCL